MMTVGKLKEKLEDFGDHLPVVILATSGEYDIYDLETGKANNENSESYDMFAVKIVTDEYDGG